MRVWLYQLDDGDAAEATRRSSSSSSRSSSCSRRSTAATASTSASTRRRRCERRLRRRMDGERVDDDLGAPGPDPARPGRDGAAAARPLDQRHGDVPRPDLLPRLPREGRAAAAHVSVHAHLGRRLLDRRGGLLARDPARRGGARRPRRGSTRPTSTRRCSSRRGSASSRSTRCRSTRRTTSAPAARARSPSTTSPRYDGAQFARSLVDNVVFAQHNLVSDAVVQRVQRDRVPQRDDLLRPAAAGPRARALLREPRDVRRARARAEGDDPLLAARAIATRSSTPTSASTGRSR